MDWLLRQGHYRAASFSCLFFLLFASKELHDELVLVLVRKGTDQCRSALRKLSKCSSLKVERREFRMDALDDAVQSLIDRARRLGRQIDAELSSEEEEGSADDSDGWAFPAAESPVQKPVDDGSPADNVGREAVGDASPCHPHMHASRKRKQRSHATTVRRKQSRSSKQRKALKEKRLVGAKRSRGRPNRSISTAAVGEGVLRDNAPTSEDEIMSDGNTEATPRARRQAGSSMRMPLSQRTALAPRNEPNGPGRGDVCAVTRMQRFIDANEDNLASEASSTASIQKRPRRQRRRRESISQGGGARRPGTPGSGRRKSLPRQQERSLQETLFAKLARRTAVEPDSPRARDFSDKSVEEICASLDAVFPQRGSISLLKEITAQCKRTTSAEMVSVVFARLASLLTVHGCESLQAFVSIQNKTALHSHIALLVACLELMDSGVGGLLQPGMGQCYDLFSPSKSKAFLRLVMVQLVDSVFSLVHPQAWALRVSDPESILRVLGRLRNALDHHVIVTDEACRVVLTEMENQKWRTTSDKRHAFVSSVNPDHWRALLQVGQAQTATEASQPTVRFNSFKKGLPRCEVEALWSLLAFFSCCTSTAPSKQPHRWALVSKVFTLSAVESRLELGSPCEAHLKAVDKELRLLATVFASGAVGSFPKSDKVVPKAVRSSILLQADDIRDNEDARMAHFPSVRHEKTAKICSKAFRGLITNAVSSPVAVTQVKKDAVTLVTTFDEIRSTELGKWSLLPSTSISYSSICLLARWIERLETIGERQAKVLRLIAEQMLADSVSSTDNSNTTRELDPFEAAFRLGQQGLYTGGSGSERRELFLRECAAYVLVTARVALGSRSYRPVSAAVDTCKVVWDCLANASMKDKQASLLDRPSQNQERGSYTGDPLRLFLAAKVVSCVGLYVLGLCPYDDDIVSCPSFVQFFEPEAWSDTTVLRYVFVCLTTCLDCACDLASSSTEVIAAIAGYMSLFVARAQQLQSERPSELEYLDSSVTCLAERLCAISLSPIQRCLRKVTASVVCRAAEDVCASAILSLLHCVLATRAPTRLDTNSGPLSGSPASTASLARSDDPWGGLDDSAFLELGPAVDESFLSSGRCASIQDIWDLLVEAVDGARPSRRFAIDPPSEPGKTGMAASMSSQGMSLVVRHLNAIADCLVALVTTGSLGRDELSRFLLPSSDFEGEDAMYFQRFARYLSKALASLAEWQPSTVRSLLQQSEPLVFTVLDEFLDADGLRKLPSSNLARIGERTGNKGEKNAFKSLCLLNEGRGGSLKMAVNSRWRSLASLRAVVGDESLDAGGTVQLGNWLAQLDLDLDNFGHKFDLLSLEKECMDRFRLFRGLASSQAFDRVGMARLFATAAARQASKSELLATNIANNLPDSVSDPLELNSCYTELHFALIAWLFRVLSEDGLSNGRTLWHRVCGSYLSPLIRRVAIDFQASLQSIASDATLLLTGRSLEESYHVRATSNESVSSDSNLYFDAIIRRSRELVLCLAREFHGHANGATAAPGILMGTLVDAGISGNESTAWLVSRSFCQRAYELGLPAGSDLKLSPFQEQIDQYLAAIEEAMPLPFSDAMALWQLKRYTIDKVLVHRLSQDRRDSAEKCGILRLLTLMLKMEEGEPTDVASGGRLEPRLMSLLTKSLRLSLELALTRSVVDEELVKAVFQCARVIANMPASCVAKTAVGWLIDWIYSNRTCQDCVYLGSFFAWVKNIGVLTMDKGVPAINSLHDQRCGLRKLKGDPACRTTVSSLHDYQAMIKSEDAILPQRQATQRVTNVYAQRQEATTGNDASEMERWVPSIAVRRVVNVLVAKVHDAEETLHAN